MNTKSLLSLTSVSMCQCRNCVLKTDAEVLINKFLVELILGNQSVWLSHAPVHTLWLAAGDLIFILLSKTVDIIKIYSTIYKVQQMQFFFFASEYTSLMKGFATYDLFILKLSRHVTYEIATYDFSINIETYHFKMSETSQPFRLTPCWDCRLEKVFMEADTQDFDKQKVLQNSFH